MNILMNYFLEFRLKMINNPFLASDLFERNYEKFLIDTGYLKL